MNARDFMTKDVYTINADQSLNDAANLMWEKDIGCVPVVDAEQHLVAMLTDRDIAMAAYLNGSPLRDIEASTAHSRNAICCRAEDDVGAVMQQMSSNRLHRIPVIDEDARVVGIVSLNDCALAYKAGNKDIRSRQLGDTIAAICQPMQGTSAGMQLAAAS
jgi:CBS domain-containing protein